MIVTSVAFYAQPVGCDFTFVFALVLGLGSNFLLGHNNLPLFRNLAIIKRRINCRKKSI